MWEVGKKVAQSNTELGWDMNTSGGMENTTNIQLTDFHLPAHVSDLVSSSSAPSKSSLYFGLHTAEAYLGGF